MMRTRLHLLLALVAVLAMAATACGGDSADDAESVVDDALSEADEVIDEVGSEVDEALDEAEEAVEDAVDGTEGDAASGDLGLAGEGTIVVGSDIAFAPFESIEDGEPVGFDIDLMDEIASRLGLETEYQNTPFDTIFTQLAGGAFDAIISAITITDEREETIDFSDPYFAANQALAVTEDSEITGVADLTGDVVLAVQAEQGNAVLAEEVETGELYGIGVQEGNTALLDAINTTLAEIIADGTYADIYSTWFEGDVPERFAS
jgi:ABC-type amino acid transport substrate-binding protein